MSRSSSGVEYGGALDQTLNYLSRYCFVSILAGPIVGLVSGALAVAFLIPIVHLFAAVPLVPGAWAINLVGERYWGRTLSRGRSWAAGGLTVVFMWAALGVAYVCKLTPLRMLIDLLGEEPAWLLSFISIPMGSSALSLALAWTVPWGSHRIQSS